MTADTAFMALLALFLGVLVVCVKPLGSYIADIMEGRPSLARRLGGRVEALIYRICGIEPGREMAWSEYAAVTDAVEESQVFPRSALTMVLPSAAGLSAT